MKNFCREFLKFIVFSCCCTMCGGSLLNIICPSTCHHISLSGKHIITLAKGRGGRLLLIITKKAIRCQ